MAQIQDLQVQCEKDMMRVRIIFDRPFYGMVFSKGHYSNVNCVHVPSGLGQTQATFDIALQVRHSRGEPLLMGPAYPPSVNILKLFSMSLTLCY
jgi:hypothetical protein